MKVAGCGLRFRWAQPNSKRRNLLLSLRAEFLPAKMYQKSPFKCHSEHREDELLRTLSEKSENIYFMYSDPSLRSG